MPIDHVPAYLAEVYTYPARSSHPRSRNHYAGATAVDNGKNLFFSIVGVVELTISFINPRC
jgi:hypothetical protein